MVLGGTVRSMTYHFLGYRNQLLSKQGGVMAPGLISRLSNAIGSHFFCKNANATEVSCLFCIKILSDRRWRC